MKYYKITCSNGYCGCDEEFYEALEDSESIFVVAEDILFNYYGFAEPDGRFIDGKSFDDEITEEEYDDHQSELCVDWEEITKEEYEENE